MEFKLTAPITPAPIEFNAAELRQELAPKLAYYQTLVVTPDSIRDAKDDRAKLRKLRDELDLRRKKVKREYLEPLETFEAEIKSITEMIDAPIAAIDEQIKAYEEQARADKRAALKAHFDAAMDAVSVPIVFDKILPPKWGNKGEKSEVLCEHIDNEIRRVCKDLGELERLYSGSPHWTAVRECYMQGYDRGAALAYAATLMQAEQEPVVVEDDDEPRITGAFRVTGTRAQIVALRNFLKSRGIEFEVII